MDTTYKRKSVEVPDDDTNGATIKTLRTDAGMPQGVLADEIGCHPSYLSDMERGNRSFSEKLFDQAKLAISKYRKPKQ